MSQGVLTPENFIEFLKLQTLPDVSVNLSDNKYDGTRSLLLTSVHVDMTMRANGGNNIARRTYPLDPFSVVTASTIAQVRKEITTSINAAVNRNATFGCTFTLLGYDLSKRSDWNMVQHLVYQFDSCAKSRNAVLGISGWFENEVALFRLNVGAGADTVGTTENKTTTKTASPTTPAAPDYSSKIVYDVVVVPQHNSTNNLLETKKRLCDAIDADTISFWFKTLRGETVKCGDVDYFDRWSLTINEDSPGSYHGTRTTELDVMSKHKDKSDQSVTHEIADKIKSYKNTPSVTLSVAALKPVRLHIEITQAKPRVLFSNVNDAPVQLEHIVAETPVMLAM